MSIWSAEIKELQKLYETFKGQLPELKKELGKLIKADDENMILLYSRRCLEVIITDLCECELKRPRKTEPLKGIIDKLNKEEKVPSNIITSMDHLNSLSAYGAHPKDFDPEQVKPVLNNLDIIIKWYLKYKDSMIKITGESEEIKDEIKVHDDTAEKIQKPKKRLILFLSGLTLVVAIVIVTLFVFNIIGVGNQNKEPEKSIAVLPFIYQGEEPDKQYLADGMMDAIHLNLSKIKDLRVMDRTSVEQYRGTKKTSLQISKELGVVYLVEGSFLKYEDNVRLIVDLINPNEEGQIWEEQYVNKWDEIFSVQSEVAQTIAKELNAAITPEEKHLIDEVPTINLKAYDFTLRAEKFYYDFFLSAKRAELEKVRQLSKAALELDSGFAQAFYWLGMSSLSGKDVSGLPIPTFLDTALIYFNKAIELDPTFAEAYASRGEYYYQQGQEQKAIDDIVKSISLSPNNPMAYYYLGQIYFYNRDYVNALKNQTKADKLTQSAIFKPPIYIGIFYIYLSAGDIQKAELYRHKMEQYSKQQGGATEIWTLEIQGKWEEELEVAEKYIARYPEVADLYDYKATALLGLGRIQEAEDCTRLRLKYSGPELNNAHRVGIVLWTNGKKEEAMKYFNMQKNSCIESISSNAEYGRGNAAYDLAGVYAILGNRKEAYKWLREYEKLGFIGGIHELIKFDPLFDNLRNDDEFKEIVKRADEKAAEIRARINELEKQGML